MKGKNFSLPCTDHKRIYTTITHTLLSTARNAGSYSTPGSVPSLHYCVYLISGAIPYPNITPPFGNFVEC
ncbi:hypothetical protein Plhal703r1_c31g0121131 [Plasmopara halstedii]